MPATTLSRQYRLLAEQARHHADGAVCDPRAYRSIAECYDQLAQAERVLAGEDAREMRATVTAAR